MTIKQDKFRAALIELINRSSQENGSNTPDYILADYLLAALDAYNVATRVRDIWYHQKVCYPGMMKTPMVSPQATPQPSIFTPVETITSGPYGPYVDSVSSPEEGKHKRGVLALYPGALAERLHGCGMNPQYRIVQLHPDHTVMDLSEWCATESEAWKEAFYNSIARKA